MLKQLKSWLPDVLAVVFFAILVFAYVYPADVEERVLKLQEKKSLVIDATVGATDDAVVSKLTFDDLRSVIGL